MAAAGFVGQNTDVDSGAAEALGSTQVVRSGIVIKALPANTGVIYVGLTSGVTAATGFPLSVGESQSFDVGWFRTNDPTSSVTGDIANIYVIASVDNQGVAYWGV